MLSLFSPYSEHHQKSGDVESCGLRKCWVIKGTPAQYIVGVQQRFAENKRLGSTSDSYYPLLWDLRKGIWAGETGDGCRWGYNSKGGIKEGCREVAVEGRG